jgi:hypothetical protein
VSFGDEEVKAWRGEKTGGKGGDLSWPVRMVLREAFPASGWRLGESSSGNLIQLGSC